MNNTAWGNNYTPERALGQVFFRVTAKNRENHIVILDTLYDEYEAVETLRKEKSAHRPGWTDFTLQRFEPHFHIYTYQGSAE